MTPKNEVLSKSIYLPFRLKKVSFENKIDYVIDIGALEVDYIYLLNQDKESLL